MIQERDLQVKDFYHTVIIAAFTNGLRDRDFKNSLTKKPPKVFVDLLLRVEKYINAEEGMAIKYQSHDKVIKEEKYHQKGRVHASIATINQEKEV